MEKSEKKKWCERSSCRDAVIRGDAQGFCGNPKCRIPDSYPDPKDETRRTCKVYNTQASEKKTWCKGSCIDAVIRGDAQGFCGNPKCPTPDSYPDPKNETRRTCKVCNTQFIYGKPNDSGETGANLEYSTQPICPKCPNAQIVCNNPVCPNTDCPFKKKHQETGDGSMTKEDATTLTDGATSAATQTNDKTKKTVPPPVVAPGSSKSKEAASSTTNLETPSQPMIDDKPVTKSSAPPLSSPPTPSTRQPSLSAPLPSSQSPRKSRISGPPPLPSESRGLPPPQRSPSSHYSPSSSPAKHKKKRRSIATEQSSTAVAASPPPPPQPPPPRPLATAPPTPLAPSSSQDDYDEYVQATDKKPPEVEGIHFEIVKVPKKSAKTGKGNRKENDQ